MSLPSPLEHSVECGMFVRARRGTDDTAPLVFVHGLGESGLCFETLLAEPRLARRRTLAPDLVGYGRSAWGAEPLTLEGHADRISEWLEHRGEARAVVVGHSMGGVVALLLAERHSERVAAVVDVEGNKSPGDCVYSGPAASQSPDAFLGGGFDALIDDVYDRGVDDPAHRAYYASLRLCDPRSFHANALELVELSATEALARRLAGLPVAAGYIAGTPGGAAPRSLELVAEAGVPVAEVRPAGHWPFIDRREAFVDVMLATPRGA